MKKAVLIIMAIMTGMISGIATAQNTPPARTINTTGTAWKEVTPDEIYVQVSLREYNKKNNDKVDIETIKNEFLKKVKALGLTDKDVSVQSYSGWNGNIILYKKNKKQNPDLKAGITYQIILHNPQQMDELVNIMDDNATQSFNVSKYDYSKMEDLKKALQIEAIKNAKEKADYTASAIGEKTGKAVTIDEAVEVGNNAPRVYYSAMAMRAKADVAQPEEESLDVDFKKIKVQYNIHVTFSLL